MVADLYKWEFHYILYRLTFAQALTLVNTHSTRERKAQEAAERQAALEKEGYVDPSTVNIDDVEQLPTLSQVRGMFG